MARRKSRKPRNLIIQGHHIVYPSKKNKEWKVPIRMTEHYVTTLLQRMKVPTKGFLRALKFYILRNETRAVSGKKIKKSQEAITKLRGKVK